MYGKIFDSIFDSTLVADGGFLPTYIFMSMIAIADKDGFVEVAPKALFRRLGFDSDGLVTYDNFTDAIAYLEQPDPDSNSSLHEGKRILPLSDMDDYDGNRGWLIVNSKAYRDKGSKEDKRRADRERIAEKRRKVAKCRKVSQKVANVAYTDTDTDIKIKDLFSYWQETMNHKKAKLDKKRKTILTNALNQYGYDDCKKAILGCSHSAFHMGDNDRQTVFDGLHVIFKDAHNTEKFISLDKPQMKANPQNKPQVVQELIARLTGSKTNPVPFKLAESEQAWRKLPPNKWDFRNEYEMNKAIQESIL